MRQRRFGNTSLIVSEVGFGCARLGGIFESERKPSILRTLRAALDEGITLFDTADMYTQGESEKLLGSAFQRDRHRIVIASKVGFCLPTQKKALAKVKPLVRPLIRRTGVTRNRIPSGLKGSVTQDFSSAHIISSLEQSLRRLRTDYLDLYQLHSPPRSVLERGEFLEPLEKLQSEGKIRYYGISCETTEDALVCLQYPGIASLQIRLSLLEQSAVPELLAEAHHRGIAIIAREIFAGGMLAKPFSVPGDMRAMPARSGQSGHLDYQLLAETLGVPLPQLALRFILNLEGVSVALIGMRTATHLTEALLHMRAPHPNIEMSVLRSPSAA